MSNITETQSIRYREAVVRLAQVAAEEFPPLPATLEAIEAMRAGTILPPAQLVAAAFLPGVGRPILHRFAGFALAWATAALAIARAERDQERAQDMARRTWAIETAGMWSPEERGGAVINACVASSAARLIAASVEG